MIGSTGSVGRQTLDVARRHPDRLRIVGLAAQRSREVLARQVAEFHPNRCCLFDGGGWEAAGGCRTVHGEDGLVELATAPDVDLVVFASAGRSGFRPLLAAIDAGKQIALANKEALVMAGDLVIRAAGRTGLTIRPVDSEHSAIWQCLQGESPENVRSLVLTASGGPFRTWSPEQLATATPQLALRHPTWAMGAKITIDSATLMNKGLEVIEAHWLFGVPYQAINVVIHPQSIVHSCVVFQDGSLKAQLGSADMRSPIQYALSWPSRWEPSHPAEIDLPEMGHLEFERPDERRFPCLRLARDAGEQGGTYPTALCAADEMAVEAFLDGRISWTDVPRIIDSVLQRHSNCTDPQLEEILEADRGARLAATLEIASAGKVM